MPVEILVNLWLGSVDNAFDKGFVTTNTIDLLVNCSLEEDYPSHMKHIRFPLISYCTDDYKEANDFFLENIIDVCGHINKTLKKNKGVLVYCYDGIQSGPAVIAAYIMLMGQLNNDIAIQTIKTKAPWVLEPYMTYKYALRSLG